MIFNYYKMKRIEGFKINIENIDLNCIDLFNECAKGLKGELTIELKKEIIIQIKIYNKKELIQELIFTEVESKYNGKKFESLISYKKVNLIIENQILDSTIIYMKTKKINFVNKDVIAKLLSSIFDINYDNRNAFTKWIILKNINITNKELKGNESFLYNNYISGYMNVSNEEIVREVLKSKEVISLNFLKCLMNKENYNKNNYVELIINNIDFTKQNKEVLKELFKNTEDTDKLIKMLIDARSIRGDQEFSQLLTYLKIREENKKLINFKELNHLINYFKESNIARLDSVKSLLNESIKNILNSIEINIYMYEVKQKIEEGYIMDEVSPESLALTYIYILKNCNNKKGFLIRLLDMNTTDNMKVDILANFEKRIIMSEEDSELYEYKETILNYHIKNNVKFEFKFINIDKIKRINLEIQYKLINLLDEKSLLINKDYFDMIKEKYHVSLQMENF